MSKHLETLRNFITSPDSDRGFSLLYGKAGVDTQKLRYLRLLEQGEKIFASSSPLIISSPGRTELGGNHTDHQNGKVLAAAVDLDCVAAVVPTADGSVTLFSDGFQDPILLNLDMLEVKDSEKGTPAAFIRGMAAAYKRGGGKIHGFSGYLNTTCRAGTGLSSSAAFSVLIGALFSAFDNKDINPIQLAHYAGFAENFYFGKPCGLMDQLSSAVGATLFIDFINPDQPQVIPLQSNFFSCLPYKLVIVDTGESHLDLTSEYSTIPTEIQSVARVLGQEKACGLTMESLLEHLPEIREQIGDRAILRLIHVINENQRVTTQFEALNKGAFLDFLSLVAESGTSSCQLLQNCTASSQTSKQGILLALALTKQFCPTATARVHGGGFAGTIQVYVPDGSFDQYRRDMEAVFGEPSVLPILVGRPGVCGLVPKGWVFPFAGDSW